MNACQKEKLSLSVRPGDEIKPPFTEEELMQLGRQYARLEGIAQGLRDDAAQEFVIAAWKALDEAEHGENIRAYQIQAGKWAVADFLKREKRHCTNEKRYIRKTYHTHDGSLSVENIVDESAVNPLEALIAKEETERAMECLRELPEREQKIVKLVIFEELTFAEVARELGVSDEYIGQVFRGALKKMQKSYFAFDGERRLE